MIETDKQQEKRRGITPRLTPNTPHLPKNPYGKTSYVVGAFGDRGRLERRDGRILRHCGKERGQRKSEKDD